MPCDRGPTGRGATRAVDRIVDIGTEGRDLDLLVLAAAAVDDVHQAEAAADDVGAAEQRLDLLGRRVGGDIEVLGLAG